MFLNPWLLAGMAAIAAPILIHLMQRRRVRRMKWAAMRFLQVVVQRNERRLRIEDRLLLLLRCLLLILLALTLARPAFRAAGSILGGGPRTVVLALDNSRGMGLTDGGSSRFDNARAAAGQIIDSLPPGSSVALLLFSDIAQPVIAEPATDLNLVRKLVSEAALTDRASNVNPALRASLDILKRHASGAGGIYLITDAQATGWKELGVMRSELADSAAQVAIVIPGPGDQPNLGVSDIALASAMAPVGTAARFRIEAANYGREDAHNVPVTLSIDGEPPSDQAVIATIPPGQSRSVSLFARMSTAGFHAVTAELPPDHLAADDRRTMVVRAVEEVRVLLVAGEMGATPREGDAFYLERALAPVAPGEQANYFINTRTVPAAELSGLKLADYDAVALVDVPRLDTEPMIDLEKYVTDGGGLMIFPGEKTDTAFYNQTLGTSLGMLPATMGPAWGDASDEAKYRSLEASGYTHPMVSIWQDPASGTLASARFFKGVALDPIPKQTPEAGEPETVVHYADGSPAIVERTWARGRVIEFSSTANTAWTDLPARPAFVLLMQRALGRLVTRRDELLNIPVGGVFTWPAHPDWLYKEMTVTPPGAQTADRGNIGLIDGEPLLQYPGADLAGDYDIAINSQPPVKMRFAAQADPEESNLATISDADLQTLAAGTRVIHWDPKTDMRRVLSGNGREFWPAFAVLALAVACCETFLAGRFSAAK